jgi:hypothetical protein
VTADNVEAGRKLIALAREVVAKKSAKPSKAATGRHARSLLPRATVRV